MTNNPTIAGMIYTHRTIAGRHKMIAKYLEAPNAEERQELWHIGFEVYGELFVLAIEKIERELKAAGVTLYGA